MNSVMTDWIPTWKDLRTLAYSAEDAVAPAKILKAFIKETKTEALTVKQVWSTVRSSMPLQLMHWPICRVAKNLLPSCLAVCKLPYPVWSTFFKAIFATSFMLLKQFVLKKRNRKQLNFNFERLNYYVNYGGT